MSQTHIESVPAEAFRKALSRRVAEGLGRPTGASGVREAVDNAVRDMIGPATQLFLLQAEPAIGKLIGSLVEQLPDVIASRRQALTERNIEALVDVFLGADPLAAAMPKLERDNAKAQARFLAAWPVLTAEDVAERAGHRSSNRSATANRWKSARRIFGLRAGGRDVYPAFQFGDDGQPKPAMAAILARLPPTLSGWQTAFWFVGANGWLDGDAPVERLGDVAAVVAAAERERDAWMG